MGIKVSNNASTNLSAGITTSSTSITVDDASEFPIISGSSDYCYGTLVGGAGVEIVKITSVSSNTLTVERAQDNTTAKTFISTERIELRNNAKMFTDYADESEDTSIAMGIALG
jgi:hypothetical protein